jgi:hypothetical protein
VESKWKNYHIITFPGQSLSKTLEEAMDLSQDRLILELDILSGWTLPLVGYYVIKRSGSPSKNENGPPVLLKFYRAPCMRDRLIARLLPSQDNTQIFAYIGLYLESNPRSVRSSTSRRKCLRPLYSENTGTFNMKLLKYVGSRVPPVDNSTGSLSIRYMSFLLLSPVFISSLICSRMICQGLRLTPSPTTNTHK